MSPDDPRHGTLNGYGNRGCRCADCRDAQGLAMIDQRVRRFRQQLSPDDPRHGRNSTYTNWGCRCSECRAAATAQKHKERLREREE